MGTTNIPQLPVAIALDGTEEVWVVQGGATDKRATTGQIADLALAPGTAKLASYTVATLPSPPTAGLVAYVIDGTSGLSWGNTVTGGHSTPYLVWYNGTNWTVVGS